MAAVADARVGAEERTKTGLFRLRAPPLVLGRDQMAERADREAEQGTGPDFASVLRDLVVEPGWEALVPFRIGRPTVEARPSPRPVGDVLS